MRVGQDGRLAARPAGGDGGEPLQAVPEVQTLAAIWAQRYERVDGRVRWRATTVDSTELLVTPHDTGVGSGRSAGTSGGATRSTSPRRSPSPPTPRPAPGRSGRPGALHHRRHDQPGPQRRRPGAGRDPRAPDRARPAARRAGGRQRLRLGQAPRRERGGRGRPGRPTAGRHLDQRLQAGRLPARSGRATGGLPGRPVATKWAVRTERDGSRSIQIRFPAAVCAACPLRPQCTTSAGGRNLSLSEHYERLVARRAEAQTPAFRARLRPAPGSRPPSPNWSAPRPPPPSLPWRRQASPRAPPQGRRLQPQAPRPRPGRPPARARVPACSRLNRARNPTPVHDPATNALHRPPRLRSLHSGEIRADPSPPSTEHKSTETAWPRSQWASHDDGG